MQVCRTGGSGRSLGGHPSHRLPEHRCGGPPRSGSHPHLGNDRFGRHISGIRRLWHGKVGRRNWLWRLARRRRVSIRQRLGRGNWQCGQHATRTTLQIEGFVIASGADGLCLTSSRSRSSDSPLSQNKGTLTPVPGCGDARPWPIVSAPCSTKPRSGSTRRFRLEPRPISPICHPHGW